MKLKLAAITILTFAFGCKSSKNSKVYTVIVPASQRLEAGIIDSATLNSLSEPMKAVAYLYSTNAADRGSSSISQTVSTDSNEELRLLKKYFSTNKLMAKRGLKPAVSTSKNNYFTSLKLSQQTGTIKASYSYDTVVHGNIQSHSNEDTYVFDGKEIKQVK